MNQIPNEAASVVLKPCPMCGETMFLTCAQTRAVGMHWWQVECGCGISGECTQTQSEAVKGWNTRKHDPSALVEALRGSSKALNAYYLQAQAEYHGHDKTAERYDDIVRAWRAEVRAALAAWEASQ